MRLATTTDRFASHVDPALPPGVQLPPSDAAPEDGGNPVREMQLLAAAVLNQAIADATRVQTITRESARAKVDARRFLMARLGEWATARRVWCDMADVLPEAFEQRVAKMLDQAESVAA